MAKNRFSYLKSLPTRYKSLIPLFGFLIFSIIIFIPLYRSGFTHTHDGENHLARFTNYYLALKQGQLPPRWAPNLDSGLGSAVLNFNYPLSNMLAFPMIVIGVHIQPIMKMLYILSLTFSFWGMYSLMKLHVNPKAACVSSLVYGLAPYQFLNYYVRGNIGESVSFAVLPWVLWSLHQLYQKDSKPNRLLVIITGSCLLLSHNIIALFASPLIIGYVLISFGRHSFGLYLKPAIIILCLVSYFWLPAYFEKSLTPLDDSPLQKDYWHHFATLEELIFSPWEHGISYDGPVDKISFRLGIFTLIGFIGSLFTLKTNPHKILAISLLVLFTICVYLMLFSSNWLWQLIPLLWFIQFPWRLLFFTTFIGSMLIGLFIHTLNNSKFANVLLIILFIITFTSLMVRPNPYFFDKDDFHWFQFPLSTTVANEYDPPWFHKDEAIHFFSDQGENKVVIEGDGQVTITKFNGTSRTYQIKAIEPIRVIEKGLYYPGWKTWVNGRLIDTDATKADRLGLINYTLEPGEYQIKSKFTQDTPWRKFGNGVTLIGIALGLWYVFGKSLYFGIKLK